MKRLNRASAEDGHRAALENGVVCPECHRKTSPQATHCPDCKLPLEWLQLVSEDFRRALNIEPSGQNATPAAIETHRPPEVPLRGRSVVWIGRRMQGADGSRVEVDDPRVALDHCIVVQQPGARRYWLADCGGPQGTFVNRRLVRSARLQSGDLIQVGRFAWIFNGEDSYLVPVGRIDGVKIELQDLTIGSRVQDLQLTIPAGQFLAITGPSGSGKSTLVKAIVGVPGAYDAGHVLVNDQTQREHESWFRSLLGYVSQEKVVLGDLQTRQAVSFAARLRRGAVEPRLIVRLLREVDLPDTCWSTRVKHLSGGEEKRLRTAAELAAEPKLLVLDEPASGLDQDRELRLLRLLRSLSYRGCTVLVVTHNLNRLDCFDRILVVDKGQIQFDGSPSELPPHAASGEFESLDRRRMEAGKPAAAPARDPFCLAGPGRSSDTAAASAGTLSQLHQFGILVRRELTLLTNAPLRRILLPVFLLPAFFATSIDIAVRTEDPEILGFLSILSAIWMGASLGLMAIVDEREVFEHERLLFLQVIPYLASKTVVLAVLAVLQAWLFVGLFWFWRSSEESGGMLFGVGQVGLILSLTGVAGLALGLLLSAVAGHHKPVAGFLLPLVMIVQIVFSMQIAGRGDAPLQEAYGEFNLHACQATDCCSRRAQFWLAEEGGLWVCEKCQSSQQRETRTPDAVVDRQADRLRPARWAALASYLTISRYADIALRSFAYWQVDSDAGVKVPRRPSRAIQFGYAQWRQEAMAALASWSGILLLATAAWLRWAPAASHWSTANWKMLRSKWQSSRRAEAQAE